MAGMKTSLLDDVYVKRRGKFYDVAVVGAGPAGLMAAKTAAEKGLEVVVIEERRDVSKITRACCQHFIMDDGAMGETLKVEPGEIIFPKNGFEVDYTGPTHKLMDIYYISPKGHNPIKVGGKIMPIKID